MYSANSMYSMHKSYPLAPVVPFDRKTSENASFVRNQEEEGILGSRVVRID